MTDLKSQTEQEPLPNQGTSRVNPPQEQKPQQPIPNQQEEDEQLIEYLEKEEGYVRPGAENELARDRAGVKAKKDQFDKDQQAKDKDKQKPSPLQQGQQHTYTGKK